MSKGGLDAAIVELQQQSGNLERLQRQHHDLATLQHTRPSKTSRGILIRLGEARRRAQSLCATLAQSWRWSNQCHDSHTARFYLEPHDVILRRSQAQMKHRRTTSGYFTLCLESFPTSGVSEYRCCAVDFVSPEDAAAEAQVQFVGETTPTASHRHSEVLDLCETLCVASSTRRHLLLEIPGGDTLQYALSSQVIALRNPHALNGELVALSEVLKYMSPISSVRTAATIAASTFLLHNTPWLGRVHRSGFDFARYASGAVDFERLMVEYRFDSAQRSRKGKCQEWQDGLIELGILILELTHNQTIEEYAIGRPNLQLDETTKTRAKAATAWLEHSEELNTVMFPDAQRAVRACMEEGTCASQIDLENAEASARTVENVVRPLWTLATGTTAFSS